MTPICKDASKLCPCVRELYVKLAADFIFTVGSTPVLVETLRAPDRQAHYVAIGASRTMRSKHLPQPPNNLSLAFDLVPSEYLPERLWAPAGPLWKVLGEAAQKLGLFWGGSWRIFPDYPHFQLEACRCPSGTSSSDSSSPS